MTLFTFHALGARNFDDHPDLEVLGKKIVDKCRGLPLAVKTLAGLLSFKVSPREWQGILNSKIWDLPQESHDILPALKLSYLHLPLNMRRCFAYCAIFPNDYEIERDELIHWWIAEGLLDGKEGESRWNVGLKLFNELVSRSLLQESSSSESQFLMHDLVSDLAKLVAGATYFISGVFDLEGDQNNAFLARHASFISSEHIVQERFKIYHGMNGLRSFISLAKQPKYYGKSYLSEKVLGDLLSELKYLRVFSLCHYHIREVPNCIGKLRHLRCLNLSYTDIKTLPESIVALYYLKALMLRGCQNLIELPEAGEGDIELPSKLETMDSQNCINLEKHPSEIYTISSLQDLTVVGCPKLVSLSEIGLPPQLEFLRILECENMKQPAREWLTPLTSLRSLDIDGRAGRVGEEKDLVLPLPSSLLKLDISDMEKVERLSSNLPPSLQILWIFNCPKLRELPKAGLPPSLKDLRIRDCGILEKRCRKGTGSYWPLIREIPRVRLGDDEFKSIT
ncbi:putative disease resistance RPP13-like protein 1 [Eucalyptus grandis]|uniref:putative disease resistance RPP13-like protein 1 n=1 Tax=Eucalyptus grandis TaxID=71139 RepID=UPI00192EABA2|nr:putative disease resistance RPP13-like protein 1 [Eucalyptus grandis]